MSSWQQTGGKTYSLILGSSQVFGAKKLAHMFSAKPTPPVSYPCDEGSAETSNLLQGIDLAHLEQEKNFTSRQGSRSSIELSVF